MPQGGRAQAHPAHLDEWRKIGMGVSKAAKPEPTIGAPLENDEAHRERAFVRRITPVSSQQRGLPLATAVLGSLEGSTAKLSQHSQGEGMGRNSELG